MPTDNYKLSTIIISIVSVIVIVGQTVYMGFFNRRWNEITYLEGQKKDLKEQLAEDEKIPKIRLSINTLGQNLESPLLKSIDKFPSTIEVKNIKGGLAENLTIKIQSDEPVVNYEKWESMNEFSIKIDESKKELSLDIKKLSPSLSVGITLITQKPITIRTEIFSDYQFLRAEGIDLKILKQEGNILEYDYYNSDISYEEFEKKFNNLIANTYTTSEARLIFQIQKINEQIKKLRNESLSSWLRDKFSLRSPSLLGIIGIAFVYLTLWGSVVIVPSLFYDIIRYKLAIWKVKKSLLLPQNINDVLRELKNPDRIKIKKGVMQLKYYHFELLGKELFAGLSINLDPSGSVNLFDRKYNKIEIKTN